MADAPPLTARRVLVGTALTAVGGFVDCFGFLTLRNVYAATMSGNTVLIAVHAGRGEAASAVLHAYAIGAFVVGLLASATVIEIGLRRGLCRVLALALALEALCLAILALWGAPLLASGAAGTTQQPHWPLYALLALAAIAMGTQNTSLRMAGTLSIFTTHITGNLTQLSEQLVNALFGQPQNGGPPHLRRAAMSAGLWLAFLAGAFAASELLPRWGAGRVLALPIAVLLAVIAADLRQPFSDPRHAGGG